MTSAPSSEEVEAAMLPSEAGRARAVATRDKAAGWSALASELALALVVLVVVSVVLTAGALVQQLGSLHGFAMMMKWLL